MSCRLHLGADGCDGVDDVCHVVEAFATLRQPVGVDARPLHRLDQLVLGAAVVEREPQRPLGGYPMVFATFALRAEQPPPPGPSREPRFELPYLALEIPHDEGNLKRRESLERWNHTRSLGRL